MVEWITLNGENSQLISSQADLRELFVLKSICAQKEHKMAIYQLILHLLVNNVFFMCSISIDKFY